MSQKKSNNDFSDRLKKLPPYLFVEIDRMKQEAIEKGADIINLGVGDPDIPTPEIIRNRMKTAVDDPDNHQYPLGKGKKVLREKISVFMKKRFGLDLDPDTQIQPLLGSKEGIAHFPLAFINPGDTVLVPEPAYPVYFSSTVFACGEAYFMPLREDNGFLPDLESVPEDILDKAKIMFLNYPNNPTGAVAGPGFFSSVVDIARKHDIIIAHDAAYTDMYFEDKPMSFLEIPGALDVGVEFHSLSKPFAMTGWRVGWVAGNSHLVEGLASIKNNIDSGVFGAIQDSAIKALDEYERIVPRMCGTYKDRMHTMAAGLRSCGWSMSDPTATFYLWTKPPVTVSSADVVKKLITEAGIVCTPGSGFGPSGEGYVRFALTRDVGRLEEAVERIKGLKW